VEKAIPLCLFLTCAVFEACQVIIQTEGIAGLYRGFWPTLMRDIPEIAIQVRRGTGVGRTS